MKLLSTLLFGFSLVFVSCDKKEPIIENVQGVMLISQTGACTILIRLNTNQTLFPTNPDKVNAFRTEGKQVVVSYRLDSEFVSPCAGATPAIIETIR